MAPSVKEMLAVANKHDAVALANEIRANKSVAGYIEPTLGLPASELVLHDDENEDPFGGNVNNRNVAKRVASGRRKWTNIPQVSHFGDPHKAARDVAKSLELNPEFEPEDVEEDDISGELAKLTPTPGSPAARAAAQTGNAEGAAVALKSNNAPPAPAAPWDKK